MMSLIMKTKNLVNTVRKKIFYIRQSFYSLKSLSYAFKTFFAGILFIGIAIILFYAWPSVKNIHSFSSISKTDTYTSFSIDAKIELLNKTTPLELISNVQVEHSINLYIQERKEDLAQFIVRSELYFPIIESILDKYGLPLELKYIAVVESGLNPRAKSKSGAVGFWQFLYNTCSLVDLEVNSYIDERCDIYKSTDAACRYLSYLYRIFDNWELAIAAYNGGPGAIRNAMEASGGKTNFWEIQAYLPKETSDYLPTFIAINFLFEYSDSYLIEKMPLKYSFTDLDSVKISQATSFQKISNELDIAVTELEKLNPTYSKNYIPQTDKGLLLVLPKTYMSKFRNRRSTIFSSEQIEASYNKLLKQNVETANKTCIVHTVQKGEFCHKLAMKYNCTIESIKEWNNLNSAELFPGQQLKIWVNTEL
jgi:membrane-bound lytic murein transglycosylase D